MLFRFFWGNIWTGGRSRENMFPQGRVRTNPYSVAIFPAVGNLFSFTFSQSNSIHPTSLQLSVKSLYMSKKSGWPSRNVAVAEFL